MEPDADVTPVQVPEQEQSEDGVAYGEQRCEAGVVPKKWDVFEASQVVDAAYQYKPAGPTAAYPVEDYGDALQRDKGTQGGVDGKRYVRRNGAERMRMGRPSRWGKGGGYIDTDGQSHKQGCDRNSDWSPHG